VIPGSGAFRSLRELIAHELAHAIQYNIIYGEGTRSYNVLYKSYFIPMWIMEGQAEYCAGYKNDSVGEMVLRDAAVKERLIPLGMLEGFNHLEEVYLAYKQSRSIFEYIDRKYGSEKISEFIKYFSGEVSGPEMFKKILQTSPERFEEEWLHYLKKKYWAQVQGRDDPAKYGPYLTKNERAHIVHDQGAALSPDGGRIAFISTKDGHRDIYVMRHDGTNRKKVFSGIEFLEFAGFPISWEKDNRTIWFAAGERGIKKLYRGDVDTGSIEEYGIDGIEKMNSPAVSPDGRFVAFTGVVGGFSNIYVFEIGSGRVKNMTNNVFENGSPGWSPLGRKLIFTEERNEYSRIAVLDTAAGEKEYLTAAGPYDCLYPRFVSENSIIFTSDRNGIFNLYAMDVETKQENQLTNVANGVFYPSVSEDFFTYSYYEDACYNIYKYLRTDDAVEVDPAEKKEPKSISFAEMTPAPGGDGELLEHIKETAAKIIKKETEYVMEFSPDIIFALVGIGTDMGLTAARI
jgi:Tol biopolymer transport system component